MVLFLLYRRKKSEVQGHRGSRLLESKATIFYHIPEGAIVGSEVTCCCSQGNIHSLLLIIYYLNVLY